MLSFQVAKHKHTVDYNGRAVGDVNNADMVQIRLQSVVERYVNQNQAQNRDHLKQLTKHRYNVVKSLIPFICTLIPGNNCSYLTPSHSKD